MSLGRFCPLAVVGERLGLLRAKTPRRAPLWRVRPAQDSWSGSYAKCMGAHLCLLALRGWPVSWEHNGLVTHFCVVRADWGMVFCARGERPLRLSPAQLIEPAACPALVWAR